MYYSCSVAPCRWLYCLSLTAVRPAIPGRLGPARPGSACNMARLGSARPGPARLGLYDTTAPPPRQPRQPDGAISLTYCGHGAAGGGSTTSLRAVYRWRRFNLVQISGRISPHWATLGKKRTPLAGRTGAGRRDVWPPFTPKPGGNCSVWERLAVMARARP